MHIGVSKTGSSAIQQALRQCRAELSEQGVYYAVTPGGEARIAEGAVTSGNAAALAAALSATGEGDAATLTPESFDRAYVSEAHTISLVSSESLSNAHPSKLGRFAEETLSRRPLRVIAFVRDLYGHALASWMQHVKWTGYSRDFAAFCRRKYQGKPCVALRRWADAVGTGAITAVHYDSVRSDVFSALLDRLDVTWRPPEAVSRVNRSLSKAELDILLRCNRVLDDGGAAARIITSHLMRKRPDKQAATEWSAESAALLEDRFGDDVTWVNQTFFAGKPVLSVTRTGAGESGEPPNDPRPEVWLDCIEALSQAAQARQDEVAQLKRERTALKEALADAGAGGAKAGRTTLLGRLRG